MCSNAAQVRDQNCHPRTLAQFGIEERRLAADVKAILRINFAATPKNRATFMNPQKIMCLVDTICSSAQNLHVIQLIFHLSQKINLQYLIMKVFCQDSSPNETQRVEMMQIDSFQRDRLKYAYEAVTILHCLWPGIFSRTHVIGMH